MSSHNERKSEITFTDLRQGRDIRTGTIIKVEPFPKTRRPAFKLKIDFGPKISMKTSIKKSSAQITKLLYSETLVGRVGICGSQFPVRLDLIVHV